MVRARPQLPAGHGELLAHPAVAEWPALVERNRLAAVGWTGELAGSSLLALRKRARADFIDAAVGDSRALGIATAPAGPSSDPIVATGHQPELYHPGVWVKDFLLQRVSRSVGATGVDVVVDSDGFDAVRITAPCWQPEVRRCTEYLSVGVPDGYYAGTPVPDAAALATFCETGIRQLSSLPAPAVARHFASFCDALREASKHSGDLAQLVTGARRRYEAAAGTDYLEVMVTSLARTASLRRFLASIALDAARFAEVYNSELAAFRAMNGTRSPAQPFPDLAVGESIELPCWYLDGSRRHGVFATPTDSGVRLTTAAGTLVDLPACADQAEVALAGSGVLLAPKALALTMYVRVFCCDLFIHGVGGARYDTVTDGVIRRFLGIEPPAFVVASLTMYLPLGAHTVTEEEIAAAADRVQRLEHNPDQLLDEVDFDTPEERERALQLAAEKRELLEMIAAQDADKKALGARIRAVNQSLRELLGPYGENLQHELERLRAQAQANDILTDRGYPFCYWSPLEISDKLP